MLLLTGKVAPACEELALAGDLPDAALLRWVMTRAEVVDVSAFTSSPDVVLASLELTWPSQVARPSIFVLAEIRALALAGLGKVDEAVRTLRGVMSGRAPGDRFRRPLYDLLTEPDPMPGLEQLLQVWREIIMQDPAAAGLWEGPEPP